MPAADDEARAAAERLRAGWRPPHVVVAHPDIDLTSGSGSRAGFDRFVESPTQRRVTLAGVTGLFLVAILATGLEAATGQPNPLSDIRVAAALVLGGTAVLLIGRQWTASVGLVTVSRLNPGLDSVYERLRPRQDRRVSAEAVLAALGDPTPLAAAMRVLDRFPSRVWDSRPLSVQESLTGPERDALWQVARAFRVAAAPPPGRMGHRWPPRPARPADTR